MNLPFFQLSTVEVAPKSNFSMRRLSATPKDLNFPQPATRLERGKYVGGGVQGMLLKYPVMRGVGVLDAGLFASHMGFLPP